MFVEPAAGGSDISNLVSVIKDRVGALPDLVWRLESVVAETIGNSWVLAGRVRFDLERARASLRFYWSADVPSIELGALPSSVSDVRFVADLSATPNLASDSMIRDGGLLGAVVPMRR
jgi:hypothetical protein